MFSASLGAHYRGFISVKYLKRSDSHDGIAVLQPVKSNLDIKNTGVVAVHMPHKVGKVTKRSMPPNAHSLNETKQPSRRGNTPDTLRQDLLDIVDWLSVDKSAHIRYQPVKGATFCNVYAHDYCHLAGVYLPRVWWTSSAIESLGQGTDVAPQYGKTIEELRANDLFRWLRDFGPRFGWRRTGTLSKLQVEANQGAVCLIVARRKEDGKSGHIVAVVPETDSYRAKRSADGEVTAPVQSQAGAVNFRYGTSKAGWWRENQFADSAFWLHA